MDVKSKVTKIMSGQPTGILATIRNQKPHSCYMMFFHEDVTLYAATDRQSKKLSDIEANNAVHVLLGRNGTSWEEEFIEVEGTASVENNAELKKQFWNENLGRWLNGPDDPNYVLLKITPKHIYYVEKAGVVQPEVLTF
ncbi:pyridoxamine 5'-phosphate oxidase family protein [Ectobacillus antri]|jgi:general stress protein 26|uniref:Pyridoxamine 5'-phosphate oxidase family protein n=1 Tax=Ectobacillus antri TaxID=2486280 RepID=A0ABT6H538_9BACI|nr:pyridoxamine 5'-phosphate oxidase family protein [Ectobacillus antri]MDG4657319.1 pyridoxamine 5'-phosphate oxidase family protein [Ectobacillus antri]MDG5754329.1 pyridoxamine 5'-phosphate oxidase family protein [Ectobacillus antri]